MDRRFFLAGGAAAATAAVGRARAQDLARLPPPPFAQCIAYSAEHNGSGLVILRNGVVWAEDYPEGRAETMRPLGAATPASFRASSRRW